MPNIVIEVEKTKMMDFWHFDWIFDHEDVNLEYMLLYEVCFSSEYLQFKPIRKALQQFWFFFIEGLGAETKRGRVVPLDVFKNSRKKITNTLDPKGTQIN